MSLKRAMSDPWHADKVCFRARPLQFGDVLREARDDLEGSFEANEAALQRKEQAEYLKKKGVANRHLRVRVRRAQSCHVRVPFEPLPPCC